MEPDEGQFSTQIVNIPIKLPDLEETQIWDDPNDSREVALYLGTKDGRVTGAEHAPFILPQRWTFATLQDCIEDYIANRLGHTNSSVSQIYYKRSGKSKAVVAINSDKDISSLLSEYPMKTNGGKRSRKSVMVLAVDIASRRETITAVNTPAQGKKSYSVYSSQPTPRRSPRLLEKGSSTLTKGAPSTNMDVFLFSVSQSVKGDLKLSKTASVIHDVPKDITFIGLKELVRSRESQTVMFVPAKGFYWLRKGTKQLVDLKNEADFQHCKDEYKDSGKTIRIACSTVSINSGSSNATTNKQTKRSLDYSTSTDADAIELQLVDAVNNSKRVKSSNDAWSDFHVDLVRDLEKKGTITRYSVRHLKLWTDLIMEGKSAGIGDEPEWEQYIDLIGVPPRRRSEKMSSPQNQDTSSDQLLKTMIIQNQRNTEMFQSSLLAILANQKVQSPLHSPPFTSGLLCSTPRPTSCTSSICSDSNLDCVEKERKKNVASYTATDCIHFLESNNLSQFVPKFVQADIDGPLLASLCHPSLGFSILEGMGINRMEGEAIVQAIKKEMC